LDNSSDRSTQHSQSNTLTDDISPVKIIDTVKKKPLRVRDIGGTNSSQNVNGNHLEKVTQEGHLSAGHQEHLCREDLYVSSGESQGHLSLGHQGQNGSGHQGQSEGFYGHYGVKMQTGLDLIKNEGPVDINKRQISTNKHTVSDGKENIPNHNNNAHVNNQAYHVVSNENQYNKKTVANHISSHRYILFTIFILNLQLQIY
jgi:hypothetical protein